MRRLNVRREPEEQQEQEPLELVKKLDAFPKVESCYVEKSARSGGGRYHVLFSMCSYAFLFRFKLLIDCSFFVDVCADQCTSDIRGVLLYPL